MALTQQFTVFSKVRSQVPSVQLIANKIDLISKGSDCSFSKKYSQKIARSQSKMMTSVYTILHLTRVLTVVGTVRALTVRRTLMPVETQPASVVIDPTALPGP